MKKRKWLVSLLAIAATVTMVPVTALAQTTERTTELDLSNQTEAETNETEGWSWTPDGEGGYTLVLENVNISSQSGNAITLPSDVDVDIILKGENHIAGVTALSGLETQGGLVTIKAENPDASLTAVSNESCMWGTISVSNLLIESGNIYTEGFGNVIDNFRMTGGSFTINQTADFDGWAALHTVIRASITGGRLEITTDEASGLAIYNYPNQIEGESGVYIGGTAEVVINNSSSGIVVLQKGSGSIADGKIEITGGTVKINSTDIGLSTAVEDIILSGGKIEITSDNIALKATNGNINFLGSDTGIKAPTPTVAGKEVFGTYHDIHQWASEWSYDDNGHWKACTNPGCNAVNEYAEHQDGTATCTEKAICSICGGEYVNASVHTTLLKTEAKPATHMTAGNIAYWYCDDCKKYFCDESGTKEIALEDTVIPKLTDHIADGTDWHSDEINHWNTCECGVTLHKAAHTFAWVTDKEATSDTAGYKHEECTVCGYKKTAIEIPATGTTEDPSKPSLPGEDPSKPAQPGEDPSKPSQPGEDPSKPSQPGEDPSKPSQPGEDPSKPSQPGEDPSKPSQPGDTPSKSPADTNPSAGNNQTNTPGAPKTGDDSHIALWIVIMLAAGTVLTGTIFYNCKRKYRR